MSLGAAAGEGGAGAGAGTSGGAGAAEGGGTPPPAAGTPPPALGEGNKGGTSWRDSLPDDLKADPTLSKYSDVTNLAKAHLEIQKKFGQKGIFKPAKDASPEEVKAFREALGIPTDPTKYELGAFEGVEVPKETVAWAQKLGAEHGIEPQAMKALIADYFKVDAQNGVARAAAAKEAVLAGLEGLRKEWGEAFDRNIQRANFAAERLGGPSLLEALKKYGADNDPVILKTFADAAKLYGEDKLREAGAGEGRSTPQEIDNEIAQVQAQLMALKPEDGRRPALKTRYESLWRQKTGGK